MPANRPPGRAVERLGDGGDLRGRESAFMAAIELVALRPDPSQNGLIALALLRGGPGFVRFLEIEDGPIVRRKRRRGVGLVLRNLDEMADMSDLQAGTMRRARAFHVDGDRLRRFRRA